jgi:hypothetical protein
VDACKPLAAGAAGGAGGAAAPKSVAPGLTRFLNSMSGTGMSGTGAGITAAIAAGAEAGDGDGAAWDGSVGFVTADMIKVGRCGFSP